jgi:hypothetical protein
MGEGNRTACDICKQTLTEADILCNGCREAITRLHMISAKDSLSFWKARWSNEPSATWKPERRQQHTTPLLSQSLNHSADEFGSVGT